MARSFNHDLLRTVRLDLGMSQEETAKALGVDVRTYRRYESGDVNATAGSFEVRNASRRKLLRRMCDELGVENEEAWLIDTAAIADGGGEAREEAAPDQSDQSDSVVALQRALHFNGREDVLETLTRWAAAPSPTTANVFVVLGVGGAGKTAVVERFVTTLHAATWIHSFYEDPSTEAVVRELSQSSAQQQQQRIVVLDGLEMVQSEGGNGRAFGELEAAGLRRALRAICTGLVPRKVLVTTRMPLTDFAAWEGQGLTTLRLESLPKVDALRVLRAWGLTGNDDALDSVIERSGGHALSLAMLGSYIGTFLGGDPSRARSIPDLREASGDDATTRKLASVLDSYANALDPQERTLMAILSLFGRAPDVTLLASLLEEEENDVLRMLARLERIGLVARATPSSVIAHPFVRDRFKRVLGDDNKVASTHARIRDALGSSISSISSKPVGFVDDPDLLDRYEELFVHTLSSGRVEDAFALYTHALGGFGNLGLRVGAMARGARVLGCFADRHAPESMNDDLPTRLQRTALYEWGLYAGALGDLRLAARCHDAHMKLLTIDDATDLPARAMGLRTRSYVAWLAGEFDRARSFLGESIAIAESIDDELDARFHLARSFAFVAMVEHDAGDRDAAQRALAKARTFEAVPTARRAFWEAEIRLATGSAGDLEAARFLTTNAIEDCTRRRWRGHVAHGHTILGRVSLATGNLIEARDHLAQAAPWVRASSEIEMALRCHDLAMQIATAGNSDTAAQSEAGLGRNLTESHGATLFIQRFR